LWRILLSISPRKEYVNVLKNLELANSKTLLVVPEMDKNLVLSQRNVKESRITLAKDINTLEIMKANTLLISEASVDKIKETLSK
jgi:large subunit ribosomal protein L4